MPKRSKASRATSPTRKTRAGIFPQLPPGFPEYTGPTEGVAVPPPRVTESRGRIRIDGFLPVDADDKPPGTRKLVPIKVSIRRGDLRALALSMRDLRQLLLLPTYEKAGFKPRGANVKGKKAARWFSAIAIALYDQLKGDKKLRDCVRRRAEKEDWVPKQQDRNCPLKVLVAYMMDACCGSWFSALKLRRPWDDVDAFAKRYLSRGARAETEWLLRGFKVLDATLAITARYDGAYPSRLLTERLHTDTD